MDVLKILLVVRRVKVNQSGKSPIQLRAVVNGKVFEISTKQFVEPSRWDQLRQEVKGRTEEARAVNNYLSDIKFKVTKEFNLLVENMDYVTSTDLKETLKGTKRRLKTLVEVFEENNTLMRKEIGSKYTANTVERYKISIARLKKILVHDILGLGITLDKLDYKFMKRYENFLFTTYNCHHNTVMKYLKHFKKVIHQAMSYV